jgi:glycosidase
VAPVFKNKPVQGPAGHESAGYHGYWITDFTQVDPHFGTNEDLRTLVQAAHGRGMKVYLDIVVNHTADVIRYRECPRNDCRYRSLADFPYSRRGGVAGEPINGGFLGDSAPNQTSENFAHLTRDDYAYTPYVPAGEEHVKVPDWLNDPIYYHNRGNTDFKGESATMGDFSGLDDLMTENPRVLQGFIDIYGAWIDAYHVDGFRIDTAKHVNPEFWQAFVPAMRARALAQGIPNFEIFGEIATGSRDPGELAVHTRVDRLPGVLDFALALTVIDTTTQPVGTDELSSLFAQDVLYAGGEATARQLPTFVSNHDRGRYGYFLRKARPGISDAEQVKRSELAYAMLFLLRGVPVIYYGDEQGFAGLGDDMAARQDMFPSQVASFNATPLIGTRATTASGNFKTDGPLYRVIAELAHLRTAQVALRRGRQVTRQDSEAPGLFAVSRFDPDSGAEILVAFNTSTKPIDAQVLVEVTSSAFRSLHGHCEPTASAPGSYRVVLAPLDFIVCAAEGAH